MTIHDVSTSYGTLTVHLASATAARVEGEALKVNGVPVTVSAWIKPSTNPHSRTPVGAPVVEHLTVKKINGTDWRWEPSWAMRDKIDAAVLSAFQTITAIPALAHEAEIAKAKSDLARAERVEAEALAALEAATEAKRALLRTLADLESAAGALTS